MKRRVLLIAVLAGAILVLNACASGASEDDLEELRSEVQTLRSDVDTLIERLEVGDPAAPASATATPRPASTPRPTQTPEPSPEPLACALSIESFSTSLRSASFEEFADITFIVRNSDDRQIRAWRLSIAFFDPFGDLLFSGAFRDGNAAVPAGGTEEAIFSYDDNQFIDDEPYDYLASFAVENLDLEVIECEVSFVDE